MPANMFSVGKEPLEIISPFETCCIDPNKKLFTLTCCHVVWPVEDSYQRNARPLALEPTCTEKNIAWSTEE